MIEILFISLIISYFVLWIYSMFKLIDSKMESSRFKLLLILVLIVLQPIGLGCFWTYKYYNNKKSLGNANTAA
jgi:hypothetical protein